MLTFLLGLIASASVFGFGLAFAFAFDFDFGAAAAATLTAEAPAVEVEEEDLAGARRARQPLKTLTAVDDDIALILCSLSARWTLECKCALML